MNRSTTRWLQTSLLTLVLAFSVAGCAVQLAPPYDKAVVEGLNTANTETMTLLASVDNGTNNDDDKRTFPAREEKYNALIGKLDALAILAGARPMPKNPVVEAISRLLAKRHEKASAGAEPLKDDDSTPPSAHAIRRISGTLAKMRDTDRKQGVTAYEAKAFKGQVEIYFDQAITYENFLQR